MVASRRSPRRRRAPRSKTRRAHRRSRRQQRGGGAPGTLDLVIAHYKEPLSWLDAPPFKDTPFRTVHLYTKNEDASVTPTCPLANCKITRLPNVGVCDHTYLHHLYTNYDTLADITVFLPASCDIPYKKPRAAQVVAAARAGEALIPAVHRPRPVHEYSAGFVLPRHVTSHEANRSPGDDFAQAPASPRPFGAWYTAHFPGFSTKEESGVGIFSVARAEVHKRPRDFYKKLMEEVSTSRYHEASHYIERSWTAIFPGTKVAAPAAAPAR